MAKLWKGYLHLLKTRTLPTQMVTGGFTSGLGDILYQQAFERRGWAGHEMYRTRRLMFFGCFCFTPVANRWHLLLSKIELSSLWKTVAARVLIDQSVFAPSATILFYSCFGLMESRPWRTVVVDSRQGGEGMVDQESQQGIRERLEERLWPTVQKQWAVFGPGQIINFSLVPLHLRPPFMNLISIGWSTFLASAQQRGRIHLGMTELEVLEATALIPQHGKSIGEEELEVTAAEIL